MKNKYDVFISYRRDGGESLACLLSERLKSKDISVFYDVESLRSGKFNEEIYNVIEHCNDIIVLLSPNSLNRCDNPDDWVRKEISCALKFKKNIIPIIMRNFEWPKTLPKELEDLKNYNGLSANMEYFDASFSKLMKLITVNQNQRFSGKEYYLIYNSFSNIFKQKRIISKLVVDQSSHAFLYNNIKDKNDEIYDYEYSGTALETEHNIYIYTNNLNSSEKLDIVFSKGAGNFHRYIGIICALSSAMLPVSFKCICIPCTELDLINDKMLDLVLSHSNREWNENLLAIESYQINAFFSEAFYDESIQ